jgi:hypothetical protein
MPLTISHPAASVPLRRFGLALSPLIVGSMAPDFSKFATLSPACGFGHSWLGAFWFSVPTGLIVLWIFHSFLKQPLFALLPLSHQKRLAPFLNRFSFKPAKQFRLVLLALLLGAFTHLGWDEFTHQTNLTVRWLPFLNTHLFEVGSYDIRVYKLLQHGSTIFGFTLLTFWYFRWFQKAPESEVDSNFLLNAKAKITAVISITGFASALGLIYGFVCATRFSHPKFLKIFLGSGVVAFGAVLAISLLVYCMIWNRHRARSKFPQQND